MPAKKKVSEGTSVISDLMDKLRASNHAVNDANVVNRALSTSLDQARLDAKVFGQKTNNIINVLYQRRVRLEAELMDIDNMLFALLDGLQKVDKG